MIAMTPFIDKYMHEILSKIYMNHLPKSVQQLSRESTLVTLTCPAKTPWSKYVDWTEATQHTWMKYCEDIKTNGAWGFSSGSVGREYHTYYWFESKDDAILFRLMSSDYS